MRRGRSSCVPPHHTSTQPWKCSPHKHPSAPQGPSPLPLHPKAHRRHYFPLLLLSPLTSHNLAHIFVYVCVSVCSLCWWLTKSPQESNLCVSPHTGCVGCRSGLGLLAEWCWLVDQAPLCLSPPPHPAPSSRPSLRSPSPVTTSSSPPSLLLLQPSLLSSTWGGGGKRSPTPLTSGQETRDAWGGGASYGAARKRGTEAFKESSVHRQRWRG